MDPSGNVYLADTGNHRVQKFASILQPDFTATPVTGIAPLAVQFNDTTPNGQPLYLEWNYGDGATSTWRTGPHLRRPRGSTIGKADVAEAGIRQQVED